MNDIITPNEGEKPSIEKIERFYSLSGGQYWRALNDIVDHPIKQGDTLLIERIDWVDGAQHTIVLRTHPSIYDKHVRYTNKNGIECGASFTSHKFLTANFLNNFRFEPDYQRIRAAEIAAVNAEVAEHQKLLIDAQVNPDIMNNILAEEFAKEVKESSSNANLPVASASMEYSPEIVSMVSGSLSNAIETGITESKIVEMKAAASRELRIAQVKGKWMTDQIKLVAETIEKLTPYFKESAAASIAANHDAIEHVNKLLVGIETLDLYVGKGVTVTTIKKGVSAPIDTKLTICQQKLFMDEELSVWCDVDSWFDFQDIPHFFETLANNAGLMNQVFPSERCILIMAANDRVIDYKDSYANLYRNEVNKNVMFAVRDGENIYTVQSPVETHLRASSLFPSQAEQDGVFRGFDGKDIKFTDLDYTNKLKAHERFALHYKRFLILICGLDHRENLFGTFYSGVKSMSFVSKEFQEDNFIFLHDRDGKGLLGHVKRPSLSTYIDSKNALIQSGSRVLCNYRALINHHTAPGVVKEREYSRNNISYEQLYHPSKDHEVHIVRKKGNDFIVDVPVSGRAVSTGNRIEFNSAVNLSKYHDDRLGYLCLDDVDPEDLQWYINNRSVRGDFLRYMRVFKLCVKNLMKEREAEKPSRDLLTKALLDGKIASTPEDAAVIANKAIINWRAANRGADLPGVDELTLSSKTMNELLGKMYMLASAEDKQLPLVIDYCEKHNLSVIRVAIGNGSKIHVYAEPLEDECDNRVDRWSWVHKLTLKKTKNGLDEASRKWVTLTSRDAAETVLLENTDLLDRWADRKAVFKTPAKKEQILAVPDTFIERAGRIMSNDQSMVMAQARKYLRERDLMNDHGPVIAPVLMLPFATYKNSSGEPRYACVVCREVPALFMSLLDESNAAEFEQLFLEPYRRKNEGKHALSEKVKWNLAIINPKEFDAENDIFFATGTTYLGGFHSLQPVAHPSLDLWIDRYLSHAGKSGRADRETKKELESLHFGTGLIMGGDTIMPQIDKYLRIESPSDYKPVEIKYVSMTFTEGNAEKTIEFADLQEVQFDSQCKPVDIRNYKLGEKLEGKGMRASWSEKTFANEREALENIAQDYIPDDGKVLNGYLKPIENGSKRFVPKSSVS